LRRYAEALAPGFVGLYQANPQSTRSLTGRGEGGGVSTVDGETVNIVGSLSGNFGNKVSFRRAVLIFIISL
jgi:hypothetical protein